MDLLEFLLDIMIAAVVLMSSRLLIALQDSLNAKVLVRASPKTALWYIRSEFNKTTLWWETVTVLAVVVVKVVLILFVNFIGPRMILMGILMAVIVLRKRQCKCSPAIVLAWSYYFGYLTKVLPKLDQIVNESKSFRDYTHHKLLILVPEDCCIHHDISKADSRLRFAENLQAVNETVSGTRCRRFTHSSYRIDAEGEILYAPLEYATPLNTLLEMSKHKKAGLSEEERDHQVGIFYETIQNIVINYSVTDDPCIKERVEFIFLKKGSNVVDEILKTLYADPKLKTC